LSTAWKNKKYRVKKKASNFKAAQRGTGGGPPPPPLDDETEKILTTIGDDGEFKSVFDSENVTFSDTENLQNRVSADEIIFEFDPEEVRRQELPDLDRHSELNR
jgi:hypothetical protein